MIADLNRALKENICIRFSSPNVGKCRKKINEESPIGTPIPFSALS
jgi:hypothetical protein